MTVDLLPTTYASKTDLVNSGITPEFWTGDLAPSDDAINTACNDASCYMDTIIGVSDEITLPLVAPYDNTLVKSCVAIAMWYLLAIRGYDPDSQTDKNIRTRYEDADKWLNKIANKKAKLQHQVTTPRSEGVQPDMVSSPSRGLRNFSGNIGGWGD